MKRILITLGIGTATVFGGVGAADVATFNPRVLPDQAHTIANERVEVRQVGNRVEAQFPWKGENGLRVKYDMGTPSLKERVQDKRSREVITERVDFAEGSMKIDVLLNTKPDTNRFCYQIEGAEDYDFFYQPPLTQEEIDQGAERPPEIVGSYAVYHKELKNHRLGAENYATGKVMHIPRPQVWEVGNKASTTEWAELSYEEGELCVTARQEFLDSADYSSGVRIDPTFGYTTAGGSALAMCNDSSDLSRRVGVQDTLSEDGTLDSMTLWYETNYASGGADTADFSLFLNTFDDPSAGSHGQVVQLETLDFSWQDVGFTSTEATINASSEVISSDIYVLSAVCNGAEMDTNHQVNATYDSVSVVSMLEDFTGATSYDSAQEDPWTDSDDGDRQFSIYATYTADAGETTVSPYGTIQGAGSIGGDGTIEP